MLVERAALAEWSVCQLCPLAVNVSGISTAQTVLRLIHKCFQWCVISAVGCGGKTAAQIVKDLGCQLDIAPVHINNNIGVV
jgi:hypothetical protein